MNDYQGACGAPMLWSGMIGPRGGGGGVRSWWRDASEGGGGGGAATVTTPAKKKGTPFPTMRNLP